MMPGDSVPENIRQILSESPLYQDFSAEEIASIVQTIASILA